MIAYPMFYRKFGIRRAGDLVKPLLNTVNAFSLPINSILHYTGDHSVEYGIPLDDVMLQGYNRQLNVFHIQAYDESLTWDERGEPRLNAVQATQLISKYTQKYRKARTVKDVAEASRDPNTHVVINYALLPHLYRYMENNFFTPYNKWYTVRGTLWAQVAKLARESNRQQYVVFDIPTILPPVSLLTKAEDNLTRSVMEKLDTVQVLDLYELWLWLGKNRSKGLMSKIATGDLNKINLVWFEAGRWVVLNLGILDNWRKDGNEANPQKREAVDPIALQRRVLRMLMAVTEARTVGGVEDEEVIEENAQVAQDVEREREADDVDMNPGEIDEKKPVLDPSAPIQADLLQSEQSTGKPVTAAKPTVAEKVKKPISKLKTAHSVVEDDDADIPETTDESEISDDLIARDLEELEKITPRKETSIVGYTPYEPPSDTLEAGVMTTTRRMAQAGLLSAAEVRRMERLSSRYKEIPNPFTKKGVLADLTVISAEETELKEVTSLVDGELPGVTDHSMLSSSLKQFDKRYIEQVMPKDIASMVLNLQHAGIAVQNYEITRVEDINDSFDIHAVKVVPVIGSPSTIRFRIPVIDENGVFKAAGVKYRMRKQRGDLPIRKIDPDTVALTSYYSKLFVNRSERAVFNYTNWLLNQVTAKGIDEADQTVTDIRLADVFDNEVDLPRAYSTLSMRIGGFKSGAYEFSFDYANRAAFFGENITNGFEKAKVKFVPVAKSPTSIMAMDYDNQLLVIDLKDTKKQTKVGTIEQFLQLPLDKRPIEIAEVGIFAKPLPLGIVLGYHLGLGNLMATLGVTPRRVGKHERANMSDDEFAVKFDDETLIFERKNKMTELIFGGFNRFHRDIKRYSVYAFDKKEVYQIVLESNGMGARFSREFDLMFKMWVDHITKELLIEMNEPTDLVGLFFSACKKLTTDSHPAAMDIGYMRDKGYERIPGMLYGELVKALRVHASKPANATASVDVNPHAVWQTIIQDPTVSPIEERNPIQSLKEKEVVVFRGQGGRSARSMTADSRSYHRSGLGVVSEATTDNGDVATITYTSADPNYKSLRGTTRRVETLDNKAAKLVSTSMLLSPGAERDDPKRVNFISIQNSQSVWAEGYTPMPLRTGYERVLAHRLDDLYAKTADDDGTIVEVTDRVIVVEYKSGKKVSHEIGRRYGTAAGEIIPHEIATPLEAGKKVKKGDVLVYNTKYFAIDTLDPKQVIMKPGALARTALMETTDTLEDGCAISQSFAKRMTTASTTVRSIKLAFDQEVHNLLKVGESVDVESILCTIENPTAGVSDLFDEQALDTLKAISSAVPKAKAAGTIERIEVIYAGEPDDMSPSLKALTEESDRNLIRHYKKLGKAPVTGQVEAGFRVDGIPMELDSAAIRVYITGPVAMGVGDKCVFGNQLKSVTARVMSGENSTEDGQPIDAIFGYQSIANRIVLSPELIGTTNALLKEIGKRAVEAYKSK